MNRWGLYFGVVVCFVCVTAASFFFGKLVLGDKVLRKPTVKLTHLPGESEPKPETADSRRNSREAGAAQETSESQRAATAKTNPHVIIEVKPGNLKPTATLTPAPSSEAAKPTRSDDRLGQRTYRSQVEEPNTTRDETAHPPGASKSLRGEVETPAPPRTRRSGRVPSPATDPDERLPRARPVTDPVAPFMTSESGPRAKGKSAEPLQPGGHRVQVGLFSGKENAEARATELRARGFTAAMAAETRDGQTVYRVQVGPFKSRDQAVKAKENLSSQGFEGFVPQ